jgi:iron complex transport system permease protein
MTREAGVRLPSTSLRPGKPEAAADPVRLKPDATRRGVRRRLAVTTAALGALLIVVCTTAPLVGTTSIDIWRAFDRSIPFADNVDAQIFFIARLPRVLASALVGAALAAAGVVFQALLRNPLATPFTLGVSSGASLGAMLAITLGFAGSLGPITIVPLASLIGATIAAGIVYALATRPGHVMSTSILLLAGVTLNSFFSALIMLTQYVSDFAQVQSVLRWLMGDLDVGGFGPIVAALPLIAVGFVLFARLPNALNLLSLGDDAAAARGVDVASAQRVAFVSATLATSAAVSLAGPIGFVGIVVPHLVRLLVGVDHRVVMPASMLFGATFLVACDVVSRMLFAPVEIPIGVITAMIGGPFFLWLLVTRG